MLKVVIDYPKKEEEKLIVRQNMEKAFPKASTILKPEDIIRAREVVKDVYMDEKIENTSSILFLPPVFRRKPGSTSLSA